MDDDFDAVLRAALADGARADLADAQAALTAPPAFSARYLRERARMLRAPFRYARRYERSPWAAAGRWAACLLAALGLSAAVLFTASPAAQAWAVRMWRTWFPDHAAYDFTAPAQSAGPLGTWRPTYVPEGYALYEEYNDGSLGVIAYIDDDGVGLSLTYMGMQDGSSFLLDNEHSTLSQTMVGIHPAELYTANAADDPSTLIWYDEAENTTFSLRGVISVDDLLQMAKSVEKLN